MSASGMPALSAPVTFTLRVLNVVELPFAVDVAVAPRVAAAGAALTARYTYVGGRAEDTGGRVIRWFRDSGAGFVHVAEHDDAVTITPASAVNDAWRFELTVYDGVLESRVITSAVAWIGDAWELRVFADGDRRVHEVAFAATSRRGRRAVRVPLPPPMRGRAAGARLEFGAATRVHGLGFEAETDRGGVR